MDYIAVIKKIIWSYPYKKSVLISTKKELLLFYIIERGRNGLSIHILVLYNIVYRKQFWCEKKNFD